jgi:hypothetical protein
MKSKFIFLITTILCQLVWTQNGPRRMIHGFVVNDSISVEDVLVFNTTANSGTTVKKEGSFEIIAREKDTLVFSSMSFKLKKIALTKDDITNDSFVVGLDAIINRLKEVVIHKKNNQSVITNSQRIVDKPYAPDSKTPPKVVGVYDGSIENGLDFVRMYKEVRKLFRKKNNTNFEEQDFSFSQMIVKKVRYDFFSTTLHLEDYQIGLFLSYCESDPKVKSVVSKTNLEVMDFLIQKHIEFIKL